jgi:hypothetical protein
MTQATQPQQKGILLTESALKHVLALRENKEKTSTCGLVSAREVVLECLT